MSSRPQETARVCKQRRPSSPVLDEAVGGGGCGCCGDDECRCRCRDGIGGGGGDGDAIRKLMWYSGESGGREQLTIVRFAKK